MHVRKACAIRLSIWRRIACLFYILLPIYLSWPPARRVRAWQRAIGLVGARTGTRTSRPDVQDIGPSANLLIKK